MPIHSFLLLCWYKNKVYVYWKAISIIIAKSVTILVFMDTILYFFYVFAWCLFSICFFAFKIAKPKGLQDLCFYSKELLMVSLDNEQEYLILGLTR